MNWFKWFAIGAVASAGLVHGLIELYMIHIEHEPPTIEVTEYVEMDCPRDLKGLQ